MKLDFFHPMLLTLSNKLSTTSAQTLVQNTVQFCSNYRPLFNELSVLWDRLIYGPSSGPSSHFIKHVIFWYLNFSLLTSSVSSLQLKTSKFWADTDERNIVFNKLFEIFAMLVSLLKWKWSFSTADLNDVDLLHFWLDHIICSFSSVANFGSLETFHSRNIFFE